MNRNSRRITSIVTGPVAWDDPWGNRWLYAFEWRTVGGRVVSTGLHLWSQDETQSLTAAVLRRFPIGARMALQRRQSAEVEKLIAATPLSGPVWQRERARRLALAKKWEESRAGRSGPKKLDAHHFLTVAEIYAEAAKRSNKPTQAVADHFVISKSAAAKQVARARGMGLLPKAQKGKPG